MIAKLERLTFYLVIIVVAILLSTAYFLPMTDLPQHAGQVAILKSIIIGNTVDSWCNEVSINYFTTYWIAYFTTLVLSFLIPINYAINTVVAIAFVSFIWSFSILRKKFNGSSLLDWILLPSFFGICYIWGFLTFLLAIPIGIFLIIQNLNFIETNNNKYIISIIFVGLLLYFSHMLVFLLFCLIASCMTIVNNKANLRFKLFQLIPFYLLALLIPIFLFSSDFFQDSGLVKYYSGNNKFYYGGFVNRFYELYQYPWGVGASSEFQVLFLLLLGIPFFLDNKLTTDLKRYVPLAIFLITWFALPSMAGRTAVVYQRMSIFLFPFYILIFERWLDNTVTKSKWKFVCSYLWIGIIIWLLNLSFIECIVLFLIISVLIWMTINKSLKKYFYLLFVLALFFISQKVLDGVIIRCLAFLLLFIVFILSIDIRSDRRIAIRIGKKLFFSYLCIVVPMWFLMSPVMDIVNFNRSTQSFKELLFRVPEHKRVLTLVYPSFVDNKLRSFTYVHFPAWYQALRNGWVDFNFAWFPPQVVRYNIKNIPEVRPGFEWAAASFIDLENCNRYNMLFVYVPSLGRYKAHERLMKKSTCSHKLLYKEGEWAVYKL